MTGGSCAATVGVAVTTIVVVVEPSTMSTVATMTPAEGATVIVAVDATVWLVVSVTVCAVALVVDELELPSTLTME